MKASTVLEFCDVSFSRGTRLLLDRISFSIRKQETTVELETIKQALNVERTVEGAELVINRFKLQVI